MSTAIELAEKVVVEMKRLQERFEGADAVAIFQVRRKLEKALFEHHKQGPRIPLRTEFELTCEICGTVQDNEDQYYLHLRKAHSVLDVVAVEKTNQQRGDHEGEMQELRRLLQKHTDYDLEDEFTHGFTGEEENESCGDNSHHSEAHS